MVFTVGKEQIRDYSIITKNESSELLDIPCRLRRNRKSPGLRALLQETRLHPSDFVQPYFAIEGERKKIPIESMPDVYRLSIDCILHDIEILLTSGIRTINLFCYTPEAKKDSLGSEALKRGNLLQEAVYKIKDTYPEIVVMADIALDPFTDHGHDGCINDKQEILNDQTVRLLGEMSLRAAEAGADVVSPSDMMDGRVGYIRGALDQNGFTNVAILSYAAKYASSFYGPFRSALDSSPKFGDKRSYQMNTANSKEALLESLLDEYEGADMLLVKPAMTYLDVLAAVSSQTNLPVGAYQVSGEYAMIKAASAMGWICEEEAIMESLLCIKRAGARFIFTYAAKQAALLLKNQPFSRF